MKIHISPGNNKIGDTPNISLPPGISCRRNAPCYDKCYARKFYRMKEARVAWDENWNFYKSDARWYFRAVRDWLNQHEPKFFRWHVSGDCPDGFYMESVFRIAEDFPSTMFLMYTKQYEILISLGIVDAPINFTVMLSAWPYLNVPDINFPRLWVQGDPRVPGTAFHCPGKCESCRMCWKGTFYNIVVKAH